MIYSKKLSFEFYNLIIFSLYGIITHMEVLHMRKVNLTMKEQTKYEIVKRFVDNKCTNYKNLALQLNLESLLDKLID